MLKEQRRLRRNELARLRRVKKRVKEGRHYYRDYLHYPFGTKLKVTRWQGLPKLRLLGEKKEEENGNVIKEAPELLREDSNEDMTSDNKQDGDQVSEDSEAEYGMDDNNGQYVDQDDEPLKREASDEDQDEAGEDEAGEEQGSLKERCVEKGPSRERKDESREKRNDTHQAPLALVKKRQEIIKKAKNKDLSDYLEYFISEAEEVRRMQEKIAQELQELKDTLLKELDEIKQVIKQSHYKPKLSEVRKAEKKARLPWKRMEDMCYALKYHQRAIRTYVDGTVPNKSPKWEASVAKALMTKELLGRQLYSAPSSRSLGREIQIKMGVQCYKQPSELASFMTTMIRDNDAIKNKKFSLMTWRRVFELELSNMRLREMYKLAGAAINESDELRGEVAGTLILNDLIRNAGGITEPAPDMTSEEEMVSWLRRHKQPVIKMAMGDEDSSNIAPTLLALIKKKLRKGMTMEGLMKNHARLLARENLEIDEKEESEDSNPESESD